jgi:hypothetical protein
MRGKNGIKISRDNLAAIATTATESPDQEAGRIPRGKTD